MVGNDPVNLLGHAAIVTAEPGLDMRHWNMQFGSGQRAGESGVCISINEDPIRLFSEKNILNSLEHRCGLSSVSSRTNSKIHFRWRHSEIFKEYSGHGMIVMLAGVNQDFLMHFPEFAAQARGFNELRPCANDSNYFQAFQEKVSRQCYAPTTLPERER